MFTVITRTANRPNYFAACRRSVLAQTMPPFHLIVTDDAADKYPKGDFVALVERKEGRGHNVYFNEVRQHIPATHPWVVFLDDDDRFETPHALNTIAQHIRDEWDVVFWQVQFPFGRLPGNLIGQHPVCGGITGIGFCYHAQHWVDWPPEPCGDFKVISKIYTKLRPVWIDAVLTGLQTVPGMGQRRDLENAFFNNMM